MYFGNYKLSQTWLEHSLKSAVWKHPLTVNMLEGFLITLRIINLKISPLLIYEILGVFVNTSTVDDKYPVPNCDNLLLVIQMQLS